MDLTLTLRLHELLTAYKDLRQAPPGGQQRRGQKFNALLAELLQAWGLTARHSVRGVDGLDETDVFFTAEQTNYILEAKWEAEPINAEPLIKLADRLNNRPPGTRGIVLSVSGYTQPALEWVKRRQDILLLDITHIEALLCGLLSPYDLLHLLYAETAAAGNRLVPLADILVPSHDDPGPAPCCARSAKRSCRGRSWTTPPTASRPARPSSGSGRPRRPPALSPPPEATSS
ncbi:restriction endonuclease [Kitasatospora aburaviensis]